ERGVAPRLVRLDLDVDLQIAEPVEDFFERRHGGAAHAQLLALGRGQLLDAARPAAQPLQIAVVEHDDVTVAVEAHVELDAVGARGARELECLERVLRRVRGSTAMRPYARPRAQPAPA